MLQRKNQKRIIIAIAVLLVLCFFYVEARKVLRIEFMSRSKVCQIWGEADFDINQFKAASGKQNEKTIRAQMACSLLRGQSPYIGKRPSKIRELLGSPTGYYNYDAIPAYAIGPSKRGVQDNWQIVFLLDRKSNVSEIAVHKNCCTQPNFVVSSLVWGAIYIIAGTFELLLPS